MATENRPWMMRTYASHWSAAESNALFRRNLAKGQTGLSVAFDLRRARGGSGKSDRHQREPHGRVGRPRAGVELRSDPSLDTGPRWLKIRWPNKTPGGQFFNSEPGAPAQGWVHRGFVVPAGHNGESRPAEACEQEEDREGRPSSLDLLTAREVLVSKQSDSHRCAVSFLS
jgi:hypothetical protein